jgi:hypothetical protein
MPVNWSKIRPARRPCRGVFYYQEEVQVLREECRVGQTVRFGLPNGEKTLAKIVKLNLTRAKVKTLEERGRNRPIGQVWNVGYDLLCPAVEGAEVQQPAAPAPRQKLVYNHWAHDDNLILEAIACCYTGLSPENLTCDGEASRTHVRQTQSRLNNRLKHLQAALGRTVTEAEAYDWLTARDDYLKREKQTT